MSDRVDVDVARNLLKSKLPELKRKLFLFLKDHNELTECLIELSDEIDRHFRNICKAKVAGSTTAIIGGVVAAVGFVGSFFTFGATLPLMIAGSAVSGAGGLTAGGSSVADVVISRKNAKQAQAKLNEFEERRKDLLAACVDIGEQLGELGDVDVNFTHWKEFWVKFLFGAGASVTSLGWNMIASPIINGLRLSTYADDVARIGVKGAAPLFKTLGTNFARGAHIAGGAAGILFMSLDIYVLVNSSLNIRRNVRHSFSKKIRGSENERTMSNRGEHF